MKGPHINLWVYDVMKWDSIRKSKIQRKERKGREKEGERDRKASVGGEFYSPCSKTFFFTLWQVFTVSFSNFKMCISWQEHLVSKPPFISSVSLKQNGKIIEWLCNRNSKKETKKIVIRLLFDFILWLLSSLIKNASIIWMFELCLQLRMLVHQHSSYWQDLVDMKV